jgi:protein-tyrosine phosphatase
VTATTLTLEEPTLGPLERSRLLRLAVRLVGGFVLLMIAGNAAIAGLSWLVRTLAPPAAVPADVVGVSNLTPVDEHLWRGAAPSLDGYESLGGAGVTTVIDLRAEADAAARDQYIESLGMRVIHIPVRDGQTPSEAQVALFAREVESADGLVFVHCGAGVGRTGSMVAAYQVMTGQATSAEAVTANLGVGPPTLEQLAYAAGLRSDDADRPPLPLVVLSRILDAPRRLMSHL